MAERKAVNKYYPPDWDPSKGSLNTYHGQHPLRERAKKIKQGILVIRFETPFNIWCLKCDRHIAKGVRFNAEKKAVGSYYSTKIWSFRMRCPSCSNEIEIQTDPKITDYVVTAGARKKVETYSAEDAEVIKLDDAEEKARKEADAFYRLESAEQDKIAAESQSREIAILRHISEKRKNTYEMSKLMRDIHRKERKEIAKEKAEAERRKKEEGMIVRLATPSAEDDLEVLTTFGEKKYSHQKAREQARQGLEQVLSTSIFNSSQNNGNITSKNDSAAVNGTSPLDRPNSQQNGNKKRKSEMMGKGKTKLPSSLIEKARRFNVPFGGKTFKARTTF